MKLEPGKSDEWFTPPEIFQPLGLTFDIDPCQPAEGRAFLSVPAKRFFTAENDGLKQEWSGLVWLNPPFGGRLGHVPWLQRLIAHGNGIGLFNALTSSHWYHDYAVQADTMVFPRGKTKFIAPDGSRGEAPKNGIVLLGFGDVANRALERSDLGHFIDNRKTRW